MAPRNNAHCFYPCLLGENYLVVARLTKDALQAWRGSVHWILTIFIDVQNYHSDCNKCTSAIVSGWSDFDHQEARTALEKIMTQRMSIARRVMAWPKIVVQFAKANLGYNLYLPLFVELCEFWQIETIETVWFCIVTQSWMCMWRIVTYCESQFVTYCDRLRNSVIHCDMARHITEQCDLVEGQTQQ